MKQVKQKEITNEVNRELKRLTSQIQDIKDSKPKIFDDLKKIMPNRSVHSKR